MNTILYIGIALIVSIFILFIANEMKKTRLDREKFNSDKLTESFNKNKTTAE
jgi:hypothetical protein